MHACNDCVGGWRVLFARVMSIRVQRSVGKLWVGGRVGRGEDAKWEIES